MNAPVTKPAFEKLSLRADRATRLTDQFEAWTIGTSQGRNVGCEIDIDAATLAEAVEQAKTHSCHKGVFIIRETRLRPHRVTLHHYRVKKSTKRFVSRPALDGDYMVREPALEAEPLISYDVNAFEPKGPWFWTTDDPTGDRWLGYSACDLVVQS